MTDVAVENKPKRLIILEAIQEGGATRESLMEAAKCSSASLGTNFTYLRLMGHYPVKNDDDTFSLATEEEWEAIKAERAAKAKTRKTAPAKTPEEVLAMAERRIERCQKALDTAETKAEQFEDEVTDLRLTVAQANMRLAEIALEAAFKEAQKSVPVAAETYNEDGLDSSDEDVADDDLV